MALDLDFVHDGSNILRGYLLSLGYRVPLVLSNEEVRRWYVNLHHRLIRPTPRRVHVAPGLVCPPEHQAGLRLVAAKIEAGEDVRAHLSKKLQQPRANDDLFNDWGITHLHLGTQIQGDGFATRTGPLLFVRFTAHDAYLIAVQQHGAWANIDFLHTLKRVWPDSIDDHRLRGVRGLRSGVVPPTAEEIAKLRRAGISVLHEIDGAVYAPPGGGYSTAGTSLRVVTEADRMADQLHCFEQDVREAEGTIRSAIAAKYPSAADPITLTLERSNDGSLYARAHDPPTLVNLNLAWILGTLSDEDLANQL